MSLTNPFLHHSTLPYQAPQFDQIDVQHYRPAFDEGVRQKHAEIDAIVQNSQVPDFANTLLALEQSGGLLTRVTSVFFAMTAAHTNDELQRLDEEFSAELANLANDIYLNGALFARVEAVWQRRGTLSLDSESIRLLEVVYQRFVLAGARLNETDKAKLKALNTESATLTSQFNQRLLAANTSGAMVVDDIRHLEGLSTEKIAVAAEAARAKGLEARWVIPILNTTQQPALAVLRDRQTREKLFTRAWTRAENDDGNDTRAIIQRLVAIRMQQAQLLGFANYAAWKIADQMAKTPEAALTFMRSIVPAARARALDEQAEIQNVIFQEHESFSAEAWDWSFYAEQVRREKYDLDEAQLKLTVISLPGNQKAAEPGWAILSSNRCLTKPDRLFTTSVIIKNLRRISLHCCCGMMLLRYFMNLAIHCTVCSPLSVMPRFLEPTLRLILSSFLHRSTNTGRAILRSLPVLPDMLIPGSKCRRHCGIKCSGPVCLTKVTT